MFGSKEYLISKEALALVRFRKDECALYEVSAPAEMITEGR
jgi:hypothetical protein